VKTKSVYCCFILALCLTFSVATSADNRCEADQLNSVALFCRSILNCDADHVSNLSTATNCLNRSKNAFAKRYNKAAAAAIKRGSICAYNADVFSASNLFLIDTDDLAQTSLTGREPLKAQNRWYASLLRSMASSCYKSLSIEAAFAKNGDAAKRQTALANIQQSLYNRLDKLIAHTSFAYTGLETSELLSALENFSSTAVTYIHPQPGQGFALSAQAKLADSVFIDSDTNDAQITPISNDNFNDAQALPVPSLVGGYVNQPRKGSAGNSYLSGDTWDVYSVSMTANQVITLSIGDAGADLDLYLYDSNGDEVSRSEGVTAFETLTTLTQGDFYVAVYAYSGASNYSLSFGQQNAGQGSGAAAEFVPGEIIVRMKDQASPAAATVKNFSAQAQQTATNLGMTSLGGARDREMLWKLSDDDNQRQQSLQNLGAPPASKTAQAQRQIMSSQAKLTDDTLLAVKALRGRDDVASADLNYIRKISTVPTDPYFARQWDLPLISLPSAWEVTTGLNSIVAVIDTGALMNHPDLQGQFVPGYDFIRNAYNSNDGDGIDPDPSDPGDNPSTGNHSYHGTHVAGTIAAISDNDKGVAGVAWSAKIMPLRVLGIGGGTDYDISQAVRYASGLSNDSGTLPAHKADAINLSLGGGGSSASAQLAFHDARAAGVIVVAAAGNEASSTPSYPAAYPGVISVSAVDTQKHLAPYSNFGSTVDVAAPGGDMSVDRNGDGFTDGILSTLATGDIVSGNLSYNYTMYQGTSMATPHMAGVVALMKAVNPSLTPDLLDALLSGGQITDDIGDTGRDNKFGYGLINARLAVDVAGGSAPTTPKLGVAPSGLNFGGGNSSLPLNLFNAGAGQLTVTSIQSDQAWLTVQPTNVDSQGLGTYTVTVDRTSVAEGTHSATLTIDASTGLSTVSVLMRVGGATVSNAGKNYYLLVNATTGAVLQTEPSPELGVYQLIFSDVPKGDYLLFGGTDMDNDFNLCDAGELCGGYPSVEQLLPITVQSDVADLVFSANFTQSLQIVSSSSVKISDKLAGLFKNSTTGFPIVKNSSTTGVKRSALIK
jgi:serine protease